jgi:hypothetical protein
MPADAGGRDEASVSLDEDPPEPDDEDDDLPGISKESDLASWEPRRPPFRLMTDVARVVLPVAVALLVVGGMFVGPDGSATENHVFWSGVAALLLYQVVFLLRYRHHAREAGVVWLRFERESVTDPDQYGFDPSTPTAENTFDLVALAALDVVLAAVALFAGFVVYA